MNATNLHLGRWKGNLPAIAVSLSFAVSFSLAGLFAYQLGWLEENRRRFERSGPQSVYTHLLTYTMDYIQNSTNYNDIVFIGDSSCLIGIDVPRIERETNLQAFNLGSINLAMVGWDAMVFATDEYISKHPKPKIIVLCVSPNSFADRGYPFVRERFFWAYKSGEEQFRPSHEANYLYYPEEGIRSIFARANDFVVSFATREDAKRDDRRRRFLTEEKGSYIHRGSAPHPDQYYRSQMTVYPNSLVQLNRLCDICSKQGIILLIRIMPYSNSDNLIIDDPVKDLLQQLSASSANVIVSHPLVLKYPDDCFWDSNHLNSVGAARLAISLSEDIRSAISKN